MAFLKRISNLSTFTEIKKVIYELDNIEIVEALEALGLETVGTHKNDDQRLQKGIKLV